jgi:hypothetical protein
MHQNAVKLVDGDYDVFGNGRRMSDLQRQDIRSAIVRF